MRLNLCGKRLKDRHCSLISCNLTNTRLVSLKLNHNDIGDVGCAFLAHRLAKNENLRELDIRSNRRITIEGVNIIKEAIARRITKLTLFLESYFIDLFEKDNRFLLTDIKDQQVTVFAPFPFAFEHRLREMNRKGMISFRDFGLRNEHVEKIANVLVKNRVVVELDLGGCLSVSFEGWKCFFSVLLTNEYLRKICLDGRTIICPRSISFLKSVISRRITPLELRANEEIILSFKKEGRLLNFVSNGYMCLLSRETVVMYKYVFVVLPAARIICLSAEFALPNEITFYILGWLTPGLEENVRVKWIGRVMKCAENRKTLGRKDHFLRELFVNWKEVKMFLEKKKIK